MPPNSTANLSRRDSKVHAGKHGRLRAAGLVGSSIEWYDFFLYGTAAALVFPHVFFPDAEGINGILLSFSTFATGFIARPIGGLLAGNYGDKLGRKPMVVISLMGMAIFTFAIGCLPSTGSIGLMAPILLVTCRFLQGMACGAQWGGLALLLSESAGPKHRAFSGSFMQVGVPCGALLGNLVFVIVSTSISHEAFVSWGWRVPFWATALLVPVVMYIQLKIEDSPEFEALKREVSEVSAHKPAVVRAPLWQAVKSNWKTILLASGTLSATNCVFYITIAGALSYGTTYLGMDYNSMLIAAMLSTVVAIPVTLLGGRLADRIGRRPVIIIGGVGILIWAFPYFALINAANMAMFTIAVSVAAIFQSLVYAPVASYFGELFAPQIRFSSVSLAYQLNAIIVSGSTPIVMTWLIAKMDGSTVGIALFVCATAVITIGCAIALRETNPKEVRQSPTAVPGEHLHANSIGG
ncbi:MAG: MFS transporter [Brevibacterium aurantiacum]|uniref:MFS transporter n=1 Tax=Brevibacterium aurantiacum TaxID=273384 RepID=UPI000DF180F6|nr:MFS transporter [Brevibacterium aurantiacum]MDN5551262.1 MHS family MFS transporter [Brevibacterium sp.]AZL08219.1 MFS transporter [Brevibacterium aurantiacum]AZL11809.1 MFS transporter [Brevibacterium aurantiacum]MDN5609398.1 MHS family MFS transporter [Brevibacterium sp.]MDN5713138.1 MHS family MFS transporter [Brevibacterium aurantiacum]